MCEMITSSAAATNALHATRDARGGRPQTQPHIWHSILVGVEFTDCPSQALDHALRLAEFTGSYVQPLHVLDRLVIVGLQEKSPQRMTLKRAVQQARISWSERHPPQAGDRIKELEVEVDEPAAVFARRAQNCASDLIVVDTDGATPDVGAGPVPKALIDAASTDVMVTRPHHDQSYASVIACLHMSEPHERILSGAVAAARANNARLFVVHAFTGPWHNVHYRAPTPETNPRFSKQYLEAMKRDVVDLCVSTVPQIQELAPSYHILENMDAGDALLGFVNSQEAPLTVVGLHPRPRWRRWLHRAMAERILESTQSSLLAMTAD